MASGLEGFGWATRCLRTRRSSPPSCIGKPCGRARTRSSRPCGGQVQFRGFPVSGIKSSTQRLTPGCRGIGDGERISIMRADVLHLLPLQLDENKNPTGRRLVNDADLAANRLAPHTVTLPDSGIFNFVPQTAGASLLVIYQDPDLAAPLTSIVVYDGLHVQAPGDDTVVPIRGFVDAVNGAAARLTIIGGSGFANLTRSRLSRDEARVDQRESVSGRWTPHRSRVVESDVRRSGKVLDAAGEQGIRRAGDRKGHSHSAVAALRLPVYGGRCLQHQNSGQRRRWPGRQARGAERPEESCRPAVPGHSRDGGASRSTGPVRRDWRHEERSVGPADVSSGSGASPSRSHAFGGGVEERGKRAPESACRPQPHLRPLRRR